MNGTCRAMLTCAAVATAVWVAAGCSGSNGSSLGGSDSGNGSGERIRERIGEQLGEAALAVAREAALAAAREAAREAAPAGPGSSSGGGADSGNDAPADACAPNGTGAVGTPGCACSPPLAMACDGNASSAPLICSGGVWVQGPTCIAGQLCDTQPGTNQGQCATEDPLCVGKSPGADSCDTSDDVVQCGAESALPHDRRNVLDLEHDVRGWLVPGRLRPRPDGAGVLRQLRDGDRYVQPRGSVAAWRPVHRRGMRARHRAALQHVRYPDLSGRDVHVGRVLVRRGAGLRAWRPAVLRQPARGM